MQYKYKLILVEWEDSQLGFQGWKEISDQKIKMPVYISVGFLVSEDENCILLYPHIEKGEDNLSGSGDILIPMSAIIKRIEMNL